ncbi:hypothetical protein GCM10007962_26930 [Yeosuana aromativorans]|uniref:Uncharacterized protein n=1 Tax=Yeosuana aromativorans TaxID=288019 RepID=A0A8J3BUX2_9FLAO|nr:hypothetical protein [Yeosuana aromativorans]GGK31134.1 hypothetical protein GCM10007962_26930 [Yeosuana aromativorans]
MKYLSAEIEAFSERTNVKSLVRPTISCGIFQDYEGNEPHLSIQAQKNTEQTNI